MVNALKQSHMLLQTGKKQTISLCGVLAETCGTRQSLATFFQERYERTHEEHQAHAKSTANI
jgi:hypothetical protein